VPGDRPYTARLEAGGSQVESLFFDPTVLDRYRLDPRYMVRIHDYSGMVCVTDEFYRDHQFPEHDKILIQTFGFASRPNGLRAVAVYLCYLADLPPQHQRHWESLQLQENCSPFAAYVRNSVLGEFNQDISVYGAVLRLLEIINKQASAMGRERLFVETFREWPADYHPILAPTLKSYLDFVSVLDKMLSQNIDLCFVGEDVPRSDARGRAKGSLQLLQDWLEAVWKPKTVEATPAALLQPLRAIRKERQRPAHKLEPNAYDLALLDAQKKLMGGAYHSLMGLATVLSKHPSTVGVPIPEILSRVMIY
jgi:hypothetical protein